MAFRKLHCQVFLLIGLLFIFNWSCKQSTELKTPTNNKLVISYLGDERIFHQDYWGMESTYWIFLPLVKNVGDERGDVQPVLAESWTHSDDYRTWTVQLRKDIYWHDGVQMTAEDIKFSIDLRKKVAGTNSNYNCEIIDDFSFIITTDKPISNLDTWNVYYPKHLLENFDPEKYFDWDFWVNPVGNGPYKFVRYVPKTMVEVEVNPNYFGKQPKIKNAILKFSNTPSLKELLSGNVDVLTYVPRDFLFKIEGDNRFKSYHWWGSWTQSILWHHNNPLFKEASVRKALTLAINRVELSEVLNYPQNIPIADVLATRAQRDNLDLPKPLPFDPEKATKLLNDSGWRDTNNDGILDKNGIDFSFTITLQGQDKLMAIYIQNNLKSINIGMEIETIEGNIIRERLENNDFDAIITSFPNSEEDVERIKTYFNKDSKIGYYNREIDSLIHSIENTGDKNEIDRLYKQLVPIFERDIPITFLVPQVQTHIVKSGIKGLSNLINADPVWSLESLWVE